MKRHTLTATLFLCAAAIAGLFAAFEFRSMYVRDDIRPSRYLTKTADLSAYNTTLAGTSGDTRVFVFDSGKPGASVLLLGGTHPNESAGFLAALLLVENVEVTAGKLFVIPQVSESGFTCTDPLEGLPERYTLTSPSGPRTFRSGSRGFNPLDQWPDPLVYLHHPSGQQLSGFETRNLNRSYPGRREGSVTERVAFAVMELIRTEHIDVAFDLHEAAPEIPIINAIVTHEKGREIAGTAVLNLQFQNLEYALELSPANFHGLSHREWGDGTPVYPFLMETSNPIQGRLRGVTNEALILNGVDEQYRQAAALGTVRITYAPEGEPVDRRVARHVQGFRALLEAFAEQFPEKRIGLDHLPTYEEITTRGVGSFLQ